jgi:hypothetical protein
MGALDDAIREHLELKRQHGASEQEIQQAEAEALGPARRDSTAEPFVDEAGMTAPFEPFDDEPPPPLASDAVEDAPPPPPPEPVPLDPATLHAVPDEPPVDEAPVEEAPVEAPPVEDDDDSDRARTAILDDPLRDAPPPVHHEPGPDEPPAPARPVDPESDSEDDVLEETPDFLQETPEHDRLWFEQKPPRDFDFDD